MAKLSFEQIVKDVAERALEESVYNGKTIKEWIKVIAEQEPCEDCISREWIKTAIHNQSLFYSILKEEDIQSYLDAAPSVKPKAEWISVKDKMPTEYEDVLVYDLDGDMYIAYAHLRADGRWGFDYSGDKIKNVIAWMPLPDAYEESEG